MNHKINVIGLISWLIFTIIVLSIAAYLILTANGYKINYQARTIQKIGMIYLKTVPENVSIYLDQKLIASKTPLKINDLLSGRYEVKISKDEYWDWQKTFQVEAGMTEDDENIELFLKNPKSLPVSDNEKQDLSRLMDEWPPKGLEIKSGSEIWFNDVFITRFSYNINRVSWYTDLKHILLQGDKKILIMEADGKNITELVNLSSDQTSDFISIEQGQQLLYSDGEEIKKVEIQ